MTAPVHFYADDADGVSYEYRLVSSRVERRRTSSAMWVFLHDGEWASMTADELELIASLIRRASDGAHGTGAKP